MDVLSLKDVQLGLENGQFTAKKLASLTQEILTDVKLFGFMKEISFCNV